ncbi:major facilitator superfamily domain-containing protein [Cristinia sonorae]|uniref:Major facilitator superfamily domain-containing protein n=1 Tax=Cristinia sonorae TaxID=1940300 RepID=A0A8K0XNI6_9AGAR|nr:major facilitator superfamily domain-containing protein [Cristinia sonorae]
MSATPTKLEVDHASISKEHSGSESADSATEEQYYPEGGRDALLTVTGSFLANLVQFGVVNLIGVMQAQYATDQLKGMSQSKISWIGTVLLFFYFFSGAFVGRIFDAVGPRIPLAVGSFLIVFGLMMVSLCKSYYQFFLAEGIILGIGNALVFYPALSVIAHWYDKKRGTMLGVSTAGASIGAVAYPIAMNKLIPLVGFPWAVRIVGFISAALLVPATLLTKSRLPRRDFGKLSDAIDFGGFRDARYCLFVIGAMIIGFGLYNPYFYSQTFSVLEGYNNNVSDYIVAIQNAGSLFGRILPGIFADKYGALNLMAISCTLGGVVLLCWMSVVNPAGLIIWGAMYGFFSGAFISLAPACVSRFTPDMSKYGGRSGLFFGMISFATLASAPIAGALFDNANGSFNGMIIFSGVVYLVGAALFWAARFVGQPRLLAVY